MKFHRYLLCLYMLFFASINGADATPEQFHVRLFESRGQVKSLKITGPFDVLRPNAFRLNAGVYDVSAIGGNVLVRHAGREVLHSKALLLRGVSAEPIHLRCGSTVRSYRGKVSIGTETIGVHEHGLRAINIVDRLDYIESVVGSEIQPKWHEEAIKAMAVLVQTSVSGTREEDALGDSTQKRVYFGSDYVSMNVRKAVNAVRGETLCYHEHPISVFYHPTCAGRTSSGVSVFGKPAQNMDYLQSVKCEFCRDAPFWNPTETHIYVKSFDTVFGEKLPSVNSFDEAKRPTQISFTRSGRAFSMSGYQFWTRMGQHFGWDKAPGLRFTMARVGDKIEIRSTGAGHGVGMCQWGANKQAELGKTYEQILQYYFPGTAVKSAL